MHAFDVTLYNCLRNTNCFIVIVVILSSFVFCRRYNFSHLLIRMLNIQPHIEIGTVFLSICLLIITFVSHSFSLHSIAATALRLMVFRFCWHPQLQICINKTLYSVWNVRRCQCKWKQQITAEKWSADIFVSCNKWHWLNWVACCFYYLFFHENNTL